MSSVLCKSKTYFRTGASKNDASHPTDNIGLVQQHLRGARVVVRILLSERKWYSEMIWIE